MGICFDIDLTTTSHTFLQCRFWSRLLVQPLDCQQNHLFISLPLRCRKFQGVPWRASAVSKPTNMGKHVEAADTMKNPWNIWKEPNQIIKSASSGCFMLQVHPNAERHPFVRAGTMYDFLIAHWWQDSFDIFGVSPYFHLKAMWVIQHFQTKKLKTQELRNPLMNWGKLNEIQKWSRATPATPGSKLHQESKSPRSRSEANSRARPCCNTAFKATSWVTMVTGWLWWPVDPWKICKFIEWKFGDMFAVIGNHYFNSFHNFQITSLRIPTYFWMAIKTQHSFAITNSLLCLLDTKKTPRELRHKDLAPCRLAARLRHIAGTCHPAVLRNVLCRWKYLGSVVGKQTGLLGDLKHFDHLHDSFLNLDNTEMLTVWEPERQHFHEKNNIDSLQSSDSQSPIYWVV